MHGHMHNSHQSQQYRQGGIDHILKERARQAQPRGYEPARENGHKHKSCFMTLVLICIGIVSGALILGSFMGQDGLLIGAVLGGFLGILCGR